MKMPADFLDQWDWLLANHPWKYEGGRDRATVMLGLCSGSWDEQPAMPAVIVMDTYWDGGLPTRKDTQRGYNWCITGKDWPDAVRIAIRIAQLDIEAARIASG